MLKSKIKLSIIFALSLILCVCLLLPTVNLEFGGGANSNNSLTAQAVGTLNPDGKFEFLKNGDFEMKPIVEGWNAIGTDNIKKPVEIGAPSTYECPAAGHGSYIMEVNGGGDFYPHTVYQYFQVLPGSTMTIKFDYMNRASYQGTMNVTAGVPAGGVSYANLRKNGSGMTLVGPSSIAGTTGSWRTYTYTYTVPSDKNYVYMCFNALTPNTGLSNMFDNVSVKMDPLTEAFVSDNGSDTSGNGSRALPFATIKEAYNWIGNNGKITLLTNITNDVSASVDFSVTNKNFTIQSDGNEKYTATIGGDGTDYAYSFNSNAIATLKNVIFEDTREAAKGIIYVGNAAQTLNLENSTLKSGSKKGNGVEVNLGTFNVNDGEITNNNIGVLLSNAAGKMNLKGSVKINNNETANINLPVNGKLNVIGTLAEDSEIGVSVASANHIYNYAFAQGANYTLTESDRLQFIDDYAEPNKYGVNLISNILSFTVADGSLDYACISGVGNDVTGEGSVAKPFKTFERAKRAIKRDSESPVAGIHVVGQVNVAGTEVWDLSGYGNAKVIRTQSYTGVLINLSGANSKLTLSNVTIDGFSGLVNGVVSAQGFGGAKPTATLIDVLNGASLTLNSGATLQNNFYNNAADGGGAVKCVNANVTLNEGSVIQNNKVISLWSGGNGAPGGGGINFYGNGKFVMNGGIIRDNVSTHWGGGIYFRTANPQWAEINGGTIENNTCDRGGGGLILDKTSYVKINGGTIQNNKSNGEAGGITLWSSFIEIYGGTISNNTTVTGSGGIYFYDAASTGKFFGDNPIIIKDNTTGAENAKVDSNVFLGGGRYLDLRENLHAQSKIGATPSALIEGTLVAKNINAEMAVANFDKIFSDVPTRPLVADGVDIEIGMLENAYVSSTGTDTPYSGIREKPFATIPYAMQNVKDGAKVILLSDVSLSSYAHNVAKTVTITSDNIVGETTNKYKILRSVINTHLFNVTNGTLNFDNVIIDGQGGINGLGGNLTSTAANSLITLNKATSTVNLTNTTLQNNRSNLQNSTASSIYILAGTINMDENSAISNNKSGSYGISINGGTFNMNGGEVSNNTSIHGGGFIVYGSSVFNMNGGEISNNTATSCGGGIYLYQTATANIYGGNIINNIATDEGGGIYNCNGKLHIKGDVVVADNQVASKTNNIHNLANISFLIDGELGENAEINVTQATHTIGTIVAKSANSYVITAEDVAKFGDDNVNKLGFENRGTSVNFKKAMLKDVYLDGVSGNDTNDGTLDKPFKTFEKAKTLLEIGGTIWIKNTVTVSSGNLTWDLNEFGDLGSGGVGKKYGKIGKYGDFAGNMIEVSGGTLTLSNVIFDGGLFNNGGVDGGNQANGDGVIIKQTGGTLNVGLGTNGVILQNNKNSQGVGGAIYLASGTLNIGQSASFVRNTDRFSGTRGNAIFAATSFNLDGKADFTPTDKDSSTTLEISLFGGETKINLTSMIVDENIRVRYLAGTEENLNDDVSEILAMHKGKVKVDGSSFNGVNVTLKGKVSTGNSSGITLNGTDSQFPKGLPLIGSDDFVAATSDGNFYTSINDAIAMAGNGGRNDTVFLIRTYWNQFESDGNGGYTKHSTSAIIDVAEEIVIPKGKTIVFDSAVRYAKNSFEGDKKTYFVSKDSNSKLISEIEAIDGINAGIATMTLSRDNAYNGNIINVAVNSNVTFENVIFDGKSDASEIQKDITNQSANFLIKGVVKAKIDTNAANAVITVVSELENSSSIEIVNGGRGKKVVTGGSYSLKSGDFEKIKSTTLVPKMMGNDVVLFEERTLTGNPSEFTFDGTPFPVDNLNVAVIGGGMVTYSFEENSTKTIGLPTNAGSYTVNVAYGEDTANSYLAVSKDFEIKINPKALTSSDVYGNVTTANIVGEKISPTVGNVTVTYQWKNSSDGISWNEISNAVSAEYEVSQSDIGKALKVSVTGTGNYKGVIDVTFGIDGNSVVETKWNVTDKDGNPIVIDSNSAINAGESLTFNYKNYSLKISAAEGGSVKQIVLSLYAGKYPHIQAVAVPNGGQQFKIWTETSGKEGVMTAETLANIEVYSTGTYNIQANFEEADINVTFVFNKKVPIYTGTTKSANAETAEASIKRTFRISETFEMPIPSRIFGVFEGWYDSFTHDEINGGITYGNKIESREDMLEGATYYAKWSYDVDAFPVTISIKETEGGTDFVNGYPSLKDAIDAINNMKTNPDGKIIFDVKNPISDEVLSSSTHTVYGEITINIMGEIGENQTASFDYDGHKIKIKSGTTKQRIMAETGVGFEIKSGDVTFENINLYNYQIASSGNLTFKEGVNAFNLSQSVKVKGGSFTIDGSETNKAVVESIFGDIKETAPIWIEKGKFNLDPTTSTIKGNILLTIDVSGDIFNNITLLDAVPEQTYLIATGIDGNGQIITSAVGGVLIVDGGTDNNGTDGYSYALESFGRVKATNAGITLVKTTDDSLSVYPSGKKGLVTAQSTNIHAMRRPIASDSEFTLGYTTIKAAIADAYANETIYLVRRIQGGIVTGDVYDATAEGEIVIDKNLTFTSAIRQVGGDYGTIVTINDAIGANTNTVKGAFSIAGNVSFDINDIVIDGVVTLIETSKLSVSDFTSITEVKGNSIKIIKELAEGSKIGFSEFVRGAVVAMGENYTVSDTDLAKLDVMEDKFTLKLKNGEVIVYETDAVTIENATVTEPYDGETNNFENAIGAVNVSDKGMTFKYAMFDSSKGENFPSYTFTLDIPTNVGKYVVEISTADDESGNWIGDKKYAAAEITKTNVLQTITNEEGNPYAVEPIYIYNNSNPIKEPKASSNFGMPSVKYFKDGVEIQFADIKAAGKYEVRVTVAGTENYDESQTSFFFEITKNNLNGKEVTIKAISDLTFTGSDITPDVEVKFKDFTFNTADYAVTYSANKNVGTASVAIDFVGDYVGHFTTTFKILPKGEIANITLKGDTDYYTYNGEEKSVNIALSQGLVESVDYTVTYQNNVNAGTANVTVTFIGNYAGVSQFDFEITPRANTITADDVIISSMSIYNGSAQEPTITVPGMVLGVDYEVVYTDNVNAGDAARATIRFKGNYSGEIVKNFSIGKASGEGVLTVEAQETSGKDSANAPEISYEITKPSTGSDDEYGTPTYTYEKWNEETSIWEDYVGEMKLTPTNVGKWRVTATFEEIGNYNSLVITDEFDVVLSAKDAKKAEIDKKIQEFDNANLSSGEIDNLVKELEKLLEEYVDLGGLEDEFENKPTDVIKDAKLDSEVKKFKEENFDVLNKTTTDGGNKVSIGDKADVEKALEDYNKLSEEAKAELGAEKELLDSLLLEIQKQEYIKQIEAEFEKYKENESEYSETAFNELERIKEDAITAINGMTTDGQGKEAVENAIKAFEKIKTLEKTPTAELSFSDKTLSGLIAGEEYQITVDGVTTTFTADENGKIAIDDAWLGKEISISKEGGDRTENSVPQKINIPQQAEAPTVNVDYSSEKLTGFEANTSYIINGVEYISNAEGEIPLSALGKYPFDEGKLEISLKSSDSSFESKKTKTTLAPRPKMPTTVTALSGNPPTISGIKDIWEYSIDGGLTWISGSNDENGKPIDITNVPSGTPLAVRVKATDTAPASEIYHPKWIDKVFKVSGGVTDHEGEIISGAIVQLMAGNTEYQNVTTDAGGAFEFSDVRPGTYNLVTTYNGQIVTTRIEIVKEMTGKAISFTALKLNSIVETTDGTPEIVVDGIDKIFGTDNYTQEDKTAAESGKTVEFKLNAEKKDETKLDESILKEIPKGKVVGMLIDFKMTKTVDTTKYDVTSLDSTIEILIPLNNELQAKFSYVIFRGHTVNGEIQVEKITETQNSDGEYLKISQDGRTLSLFVKKFSDYVLTFENTKPSSGGSYDFGTPSIPNISEIVIKNPSDIGGTGSISGITNGMEYSVDGGKTWIQGDGNDVTNIAGGTEVLIRGRGMLNERSESISVVIGEFTASQEKTPNGKISGDKIIGLVPNAEYLINGKTYFADGNGQITIEKTWIGTQISIVKVGNGSTTIDSLAENLTIEDMSVDFVHWLILLVMAVYVAFSAITVTKNKSVKKFNWIVLALYSIALIIFAFILSCIICKIFFGVALLVAAASALILAIVKLKEKKEKQDAE